MDNEEARTVLARELGTYRGKTYNDLLPLLDETVHLEIDGASGAQYQVAIYAAWDYKPKGDLRIFGEVLRRGSSQY